MDTKNILKACLLCTVDVTHEIFFVEKGFSWFITFTDNDTTYFNVEELMQKTVIGVQNQFSLPVLLETRV